MPEATSPPLLSQPGLSPEAHDPSLEARLLVFLEDVVGVVGK